MEVSTCFLLIPLKKGYVPNLTPDQLREILQPEERYFGISVFDAHEFSSLCVESKLSFSQLAALSDFKSVLTCRSAFQGPHCSAPSNDKCLASNHEKGRVVISVDTWSAVVDAVKPDLAVTMCDTIPLGENQARKQRAAKRRSELWNGECVKRQQEASCLVVQPYGNAHPSGFVHSIPQNENLLEFAINLRSLKLSSASVSIGFAFSIPQLLASLINRVELIESTIPWDLADKGIALVMDVNEDNNNLSAASEPQIDLNSAEFTYDIGPLCHDCSCYTCKRHNRAYIHHLLTVQEMNSGILLAIHNLSRMAQLVRKYRTATTDEARTKIIKHVIAQY